MDCLAYFILRKGILVAVARYDGSGASLRGTVTDFVAYIGVSDCSILLWRAFELEYFFSWTVAFLSVKTLLLLMIWRCWALACVSVVIT